MAKKQAAAAIDNRHYDIGLAPHITEKSTMLSDNNDAGSAQGDAKSSDGGDNAAGADDSKEG